MGMLDNKAAIVTGATSGIGKRTAELFVTEGAAVVFTGRRKVEGEAIAQRLGKGPSYVAADATSEADWQRVTSLAMKHHDEDNKGLQFGVKAPTGLATQL